MSWSEKFEIWIEQNKTREWLLARLEYINTYYPNQLEDGEYEEILEAINEAYPV
jgi:hypothetical protein